MDDLKLAEEGGDAASTMSSQRSTPFATRTTNATAYLWRRFLTTKTGQALMIISFLMPFLFITVSLLFTEEYYRAGCYGCQLSRKENLLQVCVMGVCQCLGLLGCFLLRKVDDPFLIVNELWIVFGVGGNLTLIGMALYASDSLRPQYLFITTFGLFIFWSAQAPWLMLVDKLKMRRKRGAFRTDKTSGVDLKMSLEDGLASPKILEAYELHLIAEMGIESLRFYRDAKAFRSRARDMTQKTRNLRAQRLARVYLGSNAVLAINISHALSGKIWSEIGDDPEEGEVPAEVFDQAILEVFNMMSKGSWPRFLKTKNFRDARAAADAAMGGAV